MAVGQRQRPLSLLATAGQRPYSPQSQPVLAGIRVPRIGPGRPRAKPAKVRADKAYVSRANRAYLRRRGVPCPIPPRSPIRSATARSSTSRGGSLPSSTRTTPRSATRSNAGSTD
nr:hypothetical protein [Streptomyces hygroscopicus]